MSNKFKELAGKTAGIQPRTTDKPGSRPAKTAPVVLYDATARMHAAEQHAEELEARLREVEKNGFNTEISLNDLYEVPTRKRKLTNEQFVELRENLRNNDLVTPITVRKRAEAGFEVISGHNRVQAYRELGRQSISAVIKDTDSARADVHAFYANLLQPTLPDYEKFLGFRLIRRQHSDWSQEQIAEMAGVSQSLLSRLLSFDELPTEAHEILSSHPNSLGASAASNLASLAKQGKAEKVIEAIRKIAEEGIDQTAAINSVIKDSKNLRQKPAMEVLTFKVGKTSLCSYRKSGTSIRVDFKTSEDAAAVDLEIQSILKKYAENLKNGKT